jgi:hypothetical protein
MPAPTPMSVDSCSDGAIIIRELWDYSVASSAAVECIEIVPPLTLALVGPSH